MIEARVKFLLLDVKELVCDQKRTRLRVYRRFYRLYGVSNAHSAGVHTREHFARALTRFYLEYLDVASSALSEADAEFLRYRQGMMAAWALDVELQRISKGKYGFRELIRLLVKQHANTDGLTKQELIAVLTTIGGERFAALYEQLTGTDASVDFSLFMKSTGIQIKPVQNPGQALKEFLKGGDSVISFAPANQSEKGFLTSFPIEVIVFKVRNRASSKT